MGAAADFVSLLQRLFCSFDGTAFLIRALGSPVQACQNRGWVMCFKPIYFEPGGAAGHTPGGPFNLRADSATGAMSIFGLTKEPMKSEAAASLHPQIFRRFLAAVSDDVKAKANASTLNTTG
jgi:hypothetical protein